MSKELVKFKTLFQVGINRIIFKYYTKKIIMNLSKMNLSKADIAGQQSGDVIIANIRNEDFFLLVDTIIAFLFSQIGYRVFILIDDGLMTHHDKDKATFLYDLDQEFSGSLKFPGFMMESKVSSQCGVLGLLWGKLKSFLGRHVSISPTVRNWVERRRGISNVPISSLLPDDFELDPELLDTYEAILQGKMSRHVEASHKRCFGGRPIDLKNNLHLSYLRASIRNEYIVKKVGEYTVRNFNPVLYISLDGNYSIFGPIRDVMEKHDIPIIIYRPDGFHDRTIYIGDRPYGVNNISEHWDYFVANDYDSMLKKKARAFLDSRVNLEGYQPNLFDIKWIKSIRDAKENYEKVIALFPNLTWDGAIKERDLIFNGLHEWIKKTIDWSMDNNILLIIREHPQPLDVYNPFESCFSLLMEIYPEIYDHKNVYFIKGTEYVNSYYLISEVVDCAVTYGGTLSVEIPYMGYPTVLAANSPYSKKNIAFEPATKDDYLNYLSKLDRLSSQFVEKRDYFKENAIKAAAYQFFYNLYYFPVMPNSRDWQKFKYTGKKYWQSWDIDFLDIFQNDRFKRTFNRFLFPLKRTIS